MKYQVKQPSYISDGLEEHPHYSPISKLVFINKADKGVSKIGALDQEGVVSVWSVIETQAESLANEYDLNMNIGYKFKLQLNMKDSLTNYSNVMPEDDPYGMNFPKESVELEFDPEDGQLFYFSTSAGLFKMDKAESELPTKYDTLGLNSPTALSMCDRGFLLAAYSCGSIW